MHLPLDHTIRNFFSEKYNQVLVQVDDTHSVFLSASSIEEPAGLFYFPFLPYSAFVLLFLISVSRDDSKVNQLKDRLSIGLSLVAFIILGMVLFRSMF